MITGKKNSLWSLGAICLTAALILVLVPTAYGQSADEPLEKEAQAIDRMIMCPVCPAETIDQAQVEISFQMRAVIREMLAEGNTRQEILDYFVDRYGADILAAPPKSGANLLAWILPIIGVAAGLVGVFFVIRSMTGRRQPAPVPVTPNEAQAAHPAQQAEPPELAPYLQIADRLLATRRASPESSPASAPLVSGSSGGEARNEPNHPDGPTREDGIANG